MRGGPTLVAEEAEQIRQLLVDANFHSTASHVGSALSMVDILAVLYFGEMKADDRFLLSKGHAVIALYATLARAGKIDPQELVGSYCKDGSIFGGHPEQNLEIGVEITAGSLGHGLAIAAGHALAARHDGTGARIFCLAGDGEMQEGSMWEAAGVAAQQELDNLCLIVDANGLQALGRTSDIHNVESLVARLASFGWHALEVDGHDQAALSQAFRRDTGGLPNAIVARTTKGYGVPFMEDELMWHYRSMTPELYAQACEALARRRG